MDDRTAVYGLRAGRKYGDQRARVSATLLSTLSVALLISAVSYTGSATADIGPLTLPDNRAWEQVSPVEKAGNDVSEAGTMPSLDGNRLLYMSSGAFPGSQTALGANGVPYMAVRGPSGWATEAMTPFGGAGSLGEIGYMGFTPTLSKGVLRWKEDELTGTVDPEAPFGVNFLNIYMRDTASGSFQLLNGTLDQIDSGGFVWGTPNFDKLAIDSPRALTTEASASVCGSGQSAHCAYEWEGGELRLASILPNGEPAQGSVGNSPFEGNFEHALSNDGRRLFFTSPSTGSSRRLYARENAETTTLVSGSERTSPGGVNGRDISFQDAEAAHGNRVIFTTENSLLDADTNESNDLYMYDFTAPEGDRLTLVSVDENPSDPDGAAVDPGLRGGLSNAGGLVGASEDLRRIYFVADNQIVAGEPEGPGPKLYLWEDTGGGPEVTYIGTLRDAEPPESYRDQFDWSAPSNQPRGVKRTARVSADGRYLVLPSFAGLTEDAVDGHNEVYRYDAVAKSLACASCAADAFPASGETNLFESLFSTYPINHLPNNVTESGQVFFETTRGLLPRDSNGKMDVYEWENGHLHLISSGTGAADSFFLDATPSGSDVFFATRDRLVGWDDDENYDAYDARVNGGLPEPPPPTPPCEGDSCQPPPVLPGEVSLGSESFEGPGDAKPRRAHKRCSAGRMRRKGRCVGKRVHRKKHAGHRHDTHPSRHR
jgi:WD40 repeat protein